MTDVEELNSKATLLKKSYNAPGEEATYTFNVKSNIEYSIGTRIIIEFSNSIPTMLSKFGLV